MEKRHIIQFLEQKKKGVYNLIVRMYSNEVTSMGVTMALAIIKEDLEKEAGSPVSLHYFSLAQAILRYKKKNAKASLSPSVRGEINKHDFKDLYELQDHQLSPGSFNRNKDKASMSKAAKSKSN